MRAGHLLLAASFLPLQLSAANLFCQDVGTQCLCDTIPAPDLSSPKRTATHANPYQSNEPVSLFQTFTSSSQWRSSQKASVVRSYSQLADPQSTSVSQQVFFRGTFQGFVTFEITVSIRSDTRTLDSETTRVKNFMRGHYRGGKMHDKINAQFTCF